MKAPRSILKFLILVSVSFSTVFYAHGNGAAVVVTRELTELFPSIPAATLGTFSSTNVITADPVYKTLMDQCQGYNNGPTCAGLTAFGIVNRATEPEVHRTMNRMVVHRPGGRRIQDVTVSGGKVVYDPSQLGEYEIGTIYLSLFQGSETAPLKQCVAKVIACGKGITQCPSSDEASGCFTALSATTNLPCDAGMTGAGGSLCTQCPSGTYKNSQGPAACTACTIPSIPNSTSVTVTSPPASTSVNDCQVNFVCSSPYTANLATRTCDAAAAACALTASVNASGSPTSASATNGSISITTSGAVGAVTFAITPASGSLSQSGNNGTYSGLGIGNYTITASDGGVTGCTRTVNHSLAPPVPLCTEVTCPSGKYLARVWDATGMGMYMSNYDGVAASSNTCRLANGNTVYSACGNTSSPGAPHFGTCSGYHAVFATVAQPGIPVGAPLCTQ